jgi:hypothetical protein
MASARPDGEDPDSQRWLRLAEIVRNDMVEPRPALETVARVLRVANVRTGAISVTHRGLAWMRPPV